MPAPRPLAATADADMLTVRWTPAVASGRVQLAATDDFAAPLADVPVSGDEMTLHDLGRSAAGLVWRIAGDDGAWSPATRIDAPIDAVPTSAATPMPGTRLVAPIDGAPVDALVPTFLWETDTDGPVTVQVSEDRTFARPLVSLETTGTSLHLPDVLTTSGRATYWRVGTATGWTPAARFRPADADHVMAWEDQRDAAARAQALAAAREADAATGGHVAYRTETTSRTFTVALLYTMLLSFVLTVAVVWRFHP